MAKRIESTFAEGKAARASAASVRSRKPRRVDPTTCDPDYGPDDMEFIRAIDSYKHRTGRQFPTWSEALRVLKSLGYTKVANG